MTYMVCTCFVRYFGYRNWLYSVLMHCEIKAFSLIQIALLTDGARYRMSVTC